jgi:serine/threonine protein kinase
MPLNPDVALGNGQYCILRLLERGGLGFVYQAQDTLLRREIAIKELILALAGDQAVRSGNCDKQAKHPDAI